MKVFYDHQTYSNQDYGGISRYFTELYLGVNGTTGHAAHLSLLCSNNVHLKENNIHTLPFFPSYSFYKKRQIQYRINKAFNRFDCKRQSFDIYHPTYYEPYLIDSIGKKPLVVTFHDLIHELFSPQFKELSDDVVLTPWKKKIAQRADCIIAVSQKTKEDIVHYFGIEPERIKVIYHGASLRATAAEPPGSRLVSEPYLLFVGNRGHYKNFLPFVTAIAPILIKHKMRLICAGGGSFEPEELAALQRLNIHSMVQQWPITDVILQKLYREAVAFVFPSLYEGFGIPVLEAFSCDCPCVLSSGSSLPEVAGAAAIYINPMQADSMADGIERIITDGTLRADLVRQGREQLTLFSWKNTIQETMALYNSL